VEAAHRQREIAEQAQRAEARESALRIWGSAKPAPDSHPYLARKAVKSHGLRVDTDGRLLVPMRDAAGELHSLQRIAADGQKRFLSGGRVSGCYFAIGRPGDVLCIAEGYATAATIHEATGYPVAVAFNAGNLLPAARAIRDKLPNVRLIVCADDDAATDGNPGIKYATEAARVVGAQLALPGFDPDRPDGATDFNDLAQHRGPEAVRDCINGAPDAGDDWPELLPLTTTGDREPYPLDALPGALGGAVREVVSFVQCPEALAACSALSVLSAAAQPLADVRRGPDLQGPISPYFLTIAESGERKSEADRRFAAILADWERDQSELLAPDLARSRAEMTAWQAEHDAAVESIKRKARDGQPTDEARAALLRLESEKPKPTRIPVVRRESATAEALGWFLAKPDGWPSAAILSSEAGIVFGGHAMRRDSIMQNLALLNKPWDGAPYRVDRKTSESYLLSGARLTMGLAAQPETVRAFFDDSHGLARGTGFAARFLIAWPISTQGARPYRDAPPNWPNLRAFQARLRALLDMPPSFNERGDLSPPVLDMSVEAFATWRAFHDEVEHELRDGGEVADVRDVASKAGENCARLAALFHIYEHGPTGTIAAEHVEAAARVVAWHLTEAGRFLGGMALPKAISNALRLEAWLVKECGARGAASLSVREAMRLGPNPTRRKVDLLAAVNELADAGRAKLSDNGREIQLNPALVRG
jgi:putative DNA primase/helicase